MAENVRATTGIAGLDDILNGGFSIGHVFLLEGSPGTGKTTIALSFLLEGARNGEAGLYITLSESENELRAGAASHGWDIGNSIKIFELTPPESLLDADKQQSLLYSSDLELGETTRMIVEEIERVKPSRIVLDSLSEIRLLAQNSLRYRRQILSLKQYFSQSDATVLLLDDLTAEVTDKTMHSVVHGVVHLEGHAPEYGGERRRVRVMKYRGSAYRGGFHDMAIRTGGVEVYPRLVALEHRTDFTRVVMTSGIDAFDSLLGGGIEQGSSALILGPAGSGKTTIAIQFVIAAIARGEKAAIFEFDEEIGLLSKRLKSLGIDLQSHVDEGSLHIEQLDAAELSPGEFAHRVKTRTSQFQAKTVVIDSLNGYQAAMSEEKSLILHMHELLQYLNRQGATTFLTVAQHGLVGDMKTPIDITYLADSVLLLRYFEAMGQMRRAVSVVKKRTGTHEETIREYRIGSGGLEIGDPLTQFQGVLLGVPVFVGSDSSELMSRRND